MIGHVRASAGNGTPIPAEVALIIEQYARAIRPSIIFIMIGTVFTTILLVLLGALVFLSTPQSRRLAVFMFNFGALTLAIVTGIVSNHLQIHAILSPLATISPIENEAWVAMYLWLPWLSEAVLIIRIIAVFKQRTARLLASVLVVPITMKIFRAVLFIMYLRNWWKDSAHPGATSANSRAIASQNWIQKAICVAELTDDAYCSAIFLWKVWEPSRSMMPKANQRFSLRSGFGSRIGVLFWMAATNFIFPVILNIIVLIVLCVSNTVVAGYFTLPNTFCTVIFTVLATVWSSGVQYKERQAISYSHRDISSSDARTAYTAYTNNDAVMISKHVHILQSPEFVDKESGKWVEHQQPDEMLLPGMDSPDARCIGIAE